MPSSPTSKESGIAERLRAKYKDDGLERLVKSTHDYYSAHGDYVPELAQLLLLERAERDALQTRLELIARNAESWHHDDEAKQRALNVIAAWARDGELPPSLVADLERHS